MGQQYIFTSGYNLELESFDESTETFLIVLNTIIVSQHTGRNLHSFLRNIYQVLVRGSLKTTNRKQMNLIQV